MKLRRILGFVTIVLLLAGSISMVGCNTVKGAGKDVEKTGEAIQGK
jgi:predicted small secreted protein